MARSTFVKFTKPRSSGSGPSNMFSRISKRSSAVKCSRLGILPPMLLICRLSTRSEEMPGSRGSGRAAAHRRFDCRLMTSTRPALSHLMPCQSHSCVEFCSQPPLFLQFGPFVARKNRSSAARVNFNCLLRLFVQHDGSGRTCNQRN